VRELGEVSLAALAEHTVELPTAAEQREIASSAPTAGRRNCAGGMV